MVRRCLAGALLLAGCVDAAPRRPVELAGTTWISPLTPAVVDTLAFDRAGHFSWYKSELQLADTGVYRRAGDTLFLDARESANPTEEQRGQGPGRFRFVVRGDTLELVYAEYRDGAPPLTKFDPPFVFTRR